MISANYNIYHKNFLAALWSAGLDTLKLWNNGESQKSAETMKTFDNGNLEQYSSYLTDGIRCIHGYLLPYASVAFSSLSTSQFNSILSISGGTYKL